MRKIHTLIFLGAALLLCGNVVAVTIDTVLIGNSGNAGELSGQGAGGFGPDAIVGAVAYDYRIGMTEVTNAQYVEFLNAVAASDSYGLYNPDMGMTGYAFTGGITRTGTSGNYVYSLKGPAVGQGPGGSDYTYVNKPVVYVSWGDAARFANWLHNGKPTGPQNASTTEDGAYTLNGANTDATLNTIVRNSGATWFIPSEGEWHKAAYYDGSTGTYFNYPTGTDVTPNNNPPSLDSGNSANFMTGFDEYATGSALYPLTDAGAYTQSASPYGTFDQGGNVWEWNEAVLGSYRGTRGSAFSNGSAYLTASTRLGTNPTTELNRFGFRVATLAIVPEPSSIALAAVALVALVALCRRKRV